MKECVTVSTIIEPTINRGLDVGLHGRTHRDGPQFHLGFGEWQEGSLYPQPGSDRRVLVPWSHAMPRARIRTVSRQPPTSIAGPKSSESDSSLHAAIEQAGDQYEDNHSDEKPSPNVGEVESPAEAAPLGNE